MLWKVFAGEMSFGELSLIKSQSHLRSHIRKDQFSYSWNCSWPLLPWALIQNQQHGHRGLKQLNWVRLQEASKSTEGKYPIKHCQLALWGVSLSFLVSSWVTYSFLYDLNVNDKGVIQQWTMQKKKKKKNVPAKTITSVQLKHLLVWLKTDMESIEHTEGGNLQKLGEVRLIKVDQLTKNSNQSWNLVACHRWV